MVLEGRRWTQLWTLERRLQLEAPLTVLEATLTVQLERRLLL